MVTLPTESTLIHKPKGPSLGQWVFHVIFTVKTKIILNTIIIIVLLSKFETPEVWTMTRRDPETSTTPSRLKNFYFVLDALFRPYSPSTIVMSLEPLTPRNLPGESNPETLEILSFERV